MKRLTDRIFALLLALLLPTLALGEETPPAVTLRLGGYLNGCEAYCRMYPHVTIEYTEDDYLSANGIITSLLTRDARYDVMAVNTSAVDVAKIFDQGYALALNASEKITAYVDSLYPALRDMVTRDGHIYAVPIHLFSTEGGYYPRSFENLGLEVPTTWQELAALINAWPEQPDDVLEDYEINEWTTNYRWWFLNKMTQNYAAYLEATGQEIHFDTPLYRELVSLVDTMTTENDAEEERDVMALMGNGYIEPFQNGYTFDTPLLDLAIEGQVTHDVTVFMVMVNPYTQHAEEALRMLEVLIDQISAPTLQTMVDAVHLAPVENPEYPQLVEQWQKEGEQLEAKLSACDEADRLDVQEEIRRHESSWTWIEASRWLITEESIPAYAEVFKTLHFSGPSVLDTRDESDPYAQTFAYTLQSRYIDGQIDMDAYIRELESRMQMVIMERGQS